MCVAVFKPKNIQLPSRQTLKNCFDRNRDGAGFALYRDNKIQIHKGFMDFDQFYNAFLNEKPKKQQNILIHFRIATHGLVDKGNTHPFPVTNNFQEMRNTNYSYDGKVLIHNGVFHYPKQFMEKYDSNGKYSDTMVFSRVLFDNLQNLKKQKAVQNLTKLGLQESIAMTLVGYKNDEQIYSNISQQIAYSKVAIMNEDGSVLKYGNWLQYNGCYFSNRSFESYTYTNNYSRNTYQPVLFDKYGFKSCLQKYFPSNICDFCGEYKTDCVECDNQNICRSCLKDFDLCYCSHCKQTFEKQEMGSKFLCKQCYDEIQNDLNDYYDDNYDDDYDDDQNYYDDYDDDDIDDYEDQQNYICLCCGQNMTAQQISQYDSEICEKCYIKYKVGDD